MVPKLMVRPKAVRYPWRIEHLQQELLSFRSEFRPLKTVCAHLNAFHAYANDPKRQPIEANHYCAQLNDDFRQCILYDSDGPNARLIGIEYMITAKLFETLPKEERRLWHSHVYEVKSGMLIMPNNVVPSSVWEVAENKEMAQVVHLYGKVYHLWQIDQGHTLPLGEPQLMTSYTADHQFDFERHVGDRDRRFDTDYKRKAELRAGIQAPVTHPDADQGWKTGD
ncbi:unnamed protein product [Clonostachys rosea f. rosea IK726]|uniref:DUF1264 domain protein n=2 Tax=Bionectria ochroleuca TaxID=29856 RepID=A0A8H7KBT7_BIOOC|nr:unnamed protein product [Clonostachys rosea f. rosea IK726]